MININIGTVNRDGACNYCNRGELCKTMTGLKYPYKKVYILSGNYISTVICEECLKKLKEIK